MTQRKKPTAMEPQRPKDTELNATTRYSQRRSIQAEDTQSQSEVPNDKTDSKQSYLIREKEEKNGDVLAKQVPGSKPASRELSPDPSTEEAGSEKEQSAEKKEQKKEQEKNAEPKQGKGGIFSGIFKKSLKPTKAAQTDEDQRSLHANLSGSNDNMSENSKLEKGGLFRGIVKKSPKLSEAPRQEEGKGGLFSGLLRKTPQTTGEVELLKHKCSFHGGTLFLHKKACMETQ
ncbi:hypothetical protein FQN60_016627 [Etheostoma spectabile]|uniref:Uncharacterized protein n=1 Tax=Etheostoma spectabile TaxID=54343 RepID=A0A5J5D5D8_9PERO|nr:hypothetical protein FQN60_016627 [Etheostoma spectabile]